jgi:hypothetical protein
MKSLPSYVKDTSDILRKLKSLPKLSKDLVLVTLDVTSLYTNIPHEDGKAACKYFLDNEKCGSKLSTEEISTLLQWTLKNNHFQFKNEIIYKF